MGRKRAFDPQTALEQAMGLFWRQGYQAVSLKELLTEMQILNGSFYHRFKDKRQLFLNALEHYNRTVAKARITGFRQGLPFGEAIRLFFEDLLQVAFRAESPGCLVINHLDGPLLSDREIAASLEASVDGMRSYLVERLRLEGRAEQEAQRIGAVLMTYNVGLLRLARLGGDPEAARGQTDWFLERMGL